MRKQISALRMFAIAIPILSTSTLAHAQNLDNVVYNIKFPDLAGHTMEIQATIPTGFTASFDLGLPVWTPGFYRVEDYAAKVKNLVVRYPDGRPLAITHPQKNRWHVRTGGDIPPPCVLISYQLVCDGRSVTTNWVGADYAIINGGASFITLADEAGAAHRPHIILMELPAQWKQSLSSLNNTPDNNTNHYIAEDYDVLVDSPIIAGNFAVHSFDVADSKHYLVDVGDVGSWDGQAAAANLEKIARANNALWGELPFKKYFFLNVFRPGGGGLEHLNSTLLTSSAQNAPPGGATRWLNFVSHEYFHAFNVKRLRPIELGPFDYERPPSTPSLWISEGLTVYYESIILARAGIGTQADLLNAFSSSIRSVQNSPGRLKQTLEQASLSVWTGGSTSGVGGDVNNTVSYYNKGAVVGFLLDAKIRHLTNGKKSLDDVMRLAMKRYGGEHGFKPEDFVAVAEEIAGSPPADMKPWFKAALGSTEELDYTDALDWYGLRFAPSNAPATAFTLELRPDASDFQKAHLNALAASN